MTRDVSRRDFVIIAAGAGAGLLVGVRIGGAQTPGRAADAWTPNAWISIDPSGAVTIQSAKAEMGQGVFTALPMIVAEELDADWEKVRIEQSPVNANYQTQTGGSNSVRSTWLPLRQAGAAARAMLGAAGAQQWKVPVSQCTTESGVVVHPASGRRAEYGTLAANAARQPVPAVESLKLKRPEEFRFVGKTMKRRDLAAKVDGSAKFGIDVRVPGMLIASVARCPVYEGAVVRVDDRKARAIPGVRQVLQFPPRRDNALPGRVAVLADTTWAAMQGRRALDITWDLGANANFSSREMLAEAHRSLAKDGDPMERVGDVNAARSSIARTFERVYEVPLLAHATMEPMNCTAHVTDTSAHVWLPTQMATRMQTRVERFLGLPAEAVVLHPTLLGGGFGRRAYDDYVIDAVEIARAAKMPVQVIWSREEDVQHDLYRPASVQRIRVGLDGAGNMITWENRVAGPSNIGFWNPRAEHLGAADPPEVIPYAVPNRFTDFVYVPAPVPIGAWRAVVNTQNAFCVESFIDELAADLKKDPIQFRIDLLAGKPRMQHVLELVRERSGWGTALPRGRGRGVAFFDYDGTYVAHVAEVSVARDGSVRVNRVICAFDCGQMINPDTVRAQIEGSVIWGLGAALYGEITVVGGRTVQSNFHDYPVPRMSETPVIDIHLVENHEAPRGVGEPAVPGIAPAIANAIQAATGQRVRRLPVRKV
jgi:isoquinoline 1-oxidoreductase beta subunit